jgi:hypothetical protein
MVAATLAFALGLLQFGVKRPTEKPVRPEFYLPPSPRPTLSEITMSVEVDSSKQPNSGAIAFPVPNDYSGQAVIGLRVTCTPPSAMRLWRLDTSPDGLNKILRITLDPTAPSARVGYEAEIVTPEEGVVRLQRKNYSSWLGPSNSVQADDPEIGDLAKKLKGEAPSQDEFVNKVVTWVASNKLRQELSPGISDARTSLKLGGSAQGRANLCAAILRAGSIPVSVVMTIPIWAERMDAVSWIDEYWTEDGNWKMVDPLVGIHEVARNSEIVLSILSVADENAEATGPIPKAGIRVIKSFPPQSGARLMVAAHRRALRVFSAAAKGQDAWIEEATLQSQLKTGPVTLALYMDRQITAPNR